ncbi:hypothetical protein CPAR01_12800 [Colletotrichum paranaense]|uniref:Uncharacterized protein n=1 Tax=Colletotrichum paranaense TaxID=1914294 RepID=A0ABQ9S7I3_9PEZI|nr:uncharacterized protein CPAR01_12800 [Colletotrichum paranaense]KAK1528242.1 hypothetical protein CPAR01_12800 [Colletotrichum paranaense]
MRNPSFGGVVRFQPLLSQRKGEWGHGAMDGYVLHKKQAKRHGLKKKLTLNVGFSLCSSPPKLLPNRGKRLRWHTDTAGFS